MGLEINSDEFNKRISKYEEELKDTEEIWSEIFIKGEKTKFAISNYGNICNMKSGKIRKPDYRKGKYYNVGLKYSEGVYKISIHRLVAFYFCKIPKRLRKQGFTYEDLVANHKNGIKSCNAAFNLEWISQKENMTHAFETGLCTDIYGENSHLSKITEKQVIEICELIMEKKTNKEISELTGISKKTIQHIRAKEDWIQISGNYDFPKLGNSTPYSMDDDKVHEICKILVLHKYSDADIARKLDVRREYVKDIRLGYRRTDISSQYDFDPSPYNPINDDMIKNVCKLLEEGELSQRKIAKKIGISQCLVSQIYHHKKFTEISSKYKF